jgi:hypothetical protein
VEPNTTLEPKRSFLFNPPSAMHTNICCGVVVFRVKTWEKWHGLGHRMYAVGFCKICEMKGGVFVANKLCLSTLKVICGTFPCSSSVGEKYPFKGTVSEDFSLQTFS